MKDALKSARTPSPSRLAYALVKGDERVIAAGPLTYQPHTRPYRIVMLRWSDGKFSVHNEIFETVLLDYHADLALAASEAESFLLEGDYFPSDQLVEAQRKFAERLTRHAGYVKSVYRV